MFDIKVYEHNAKYYETDKMGIIHHSNYIRWFEEARIDFLNQINFGYKQMEEQGIVSPVLSVNCEFKSMVHFDDTVLVYVRVKEYKGVKFTLGYEIRDKVTDELRTLGTTTHCFLNNEGKIVNIKKEMNEFHNALLAHVH